MKRLNNINNYKNLAAGKYVLRRLNYRKDMGDDIPSLLDIAKVEHKGDDVIIFEQVLGILPCPKWLPCPLPNWLWHLYYGTQWAYDLRDTDDMSRLGLTGNEESHSYWELTEDEVQLHFFINAI